MRRPWTAAERVQMSERMQRAWADGKFANRPKPRMPDRWTPPEDKLLRELTGTMPLDQIAQRISERFGLPRTTEAVRIRAVRTGVSVYVNCWTMRAVEELFHLDHRAIARHWIAPGLLNASRWAGRGPNDGWWIEERDVERFVRDHGYAYDWTKMTPGHRLTRLAEVVHRADPWRTRAELMAYVGISDSNLTKWQKRGLVPHCFRPNGGSMRVMIRGRDFAAIAEWIHEAQRQARESSWQQFAERRRARIRQEVAA